MPVHASVAYNELIKDTVIVRSMSRAGKPTDNPVNESINGWMKEELYMDFKIDECKRRNEFEEVLERYVNFYNNHCPCYAIGYDTPANYRKRYYKGELERKNEQYLDEASPHDIFMCEQALAGNNKVFIISAFPEFLVDYFGMKLWRTCVKHAKNQLDICNCK